MQHVPEIESYLTLFTYFSYRKIIEIYEKNDFAIFIEISVE